MHAHDLHVMGHSGLACEDAYAYVHDSCIVASSDPSAHGPNFARRCHGAGLTGLDADNADRFKS